MGDVWFINNNDSARKNDMLKNKVISPGWSCLLDEMSSNELNGESISAGAFEKAFSKYDEKKYKHQSIYFFTRIKKDDIVAIRKKGFFYLAKVKDGKIHVRPYESEESKDQRITLDVVEWKEIGGIADVPGFLQIHRQGTIAHIPDDGSQHIYEICDHLGFGAPLSELKRNNIYQYIGPSGLEDIFATYLQRKYGYYVLPSTDKISTEKYECALIDPENGQIIYFQAKNGSINLETERYKKDFKNDKNGNIKEIWLITTGGKIDDKYNIVKINKDLSSSDVDLSELTNFIYDKENQNIISPFIKKFIQY